MASSSPVGNDIELPEKLLVKDCAGKYLIPGMVDVHVHFRDPGQEYKEDILTGMRAAAHGGFTGVVPMANTKPVIDTGAMIDYLLEKAAWEPGRTRIYPLGACTKGLAGKELAEMGDMVAAGAVAFSDDGHGIQDGGMMRQVLDYAKMFDVPVLSHCQMEDIVGAGVVNEGVASTRLGLAGWPAAGEETQIMRDIELARLTGCHVHIQHLTTARAVDMVARAKAEGVPVTCEVTPHHLFLNEDDIKADNYSTNLKMNPPLRTKEDNLALQEALIDGRIDMVATDHAPHAAHEKALEFNHAPFGTTGLETALGLLLTELVLPGKMSCSASSRSRPSLRVNSSASSKSSCARAPRPTTRSSTPLLIGWSRPMTSTRAPRTRRFSDGNSQGVQRMSSWMVMPAWKMVS